jgi:hypothetical protein
MTTPPKVALPADVASDRGVYDSLEALRALLIPGEQIEAMAIQRRVFALKHRRVAVAATSGRLIVVRRNLIGGYKPNDCRWQDIRDSAVTVGIFGATLTVAVNANTDLAIDESPARMISVPGLRKTEAQEVYRICQAREQQWREKRRIRELEEMRAKSGGMQFAGGGMPMGGMGMGGGGDGMSPMERLQRAKDMRQSGLLNDAEFEQIKAKILAEL